MALPTNPIASNPSAARPFAVSPMSTPARKDYGAQHHDRGRPRVAPRAEGPGQRRLGAVRGEG
jgi:hypothetical protein